ncbi:MAG: CCA tRNA nucleotidyltransferase [Fusobacterium sp.]|nr:CCA tRNA nucleotidyltransferase [Fusobacterium sp.]
MKKKIILELEKDILDILKILQSKSEKSYIVGGYIRDKFLNLKPHDCDFCTNLSLEDIFSLFSEKKDFEIKIISENLNIVQLKYNKKKFEIARLREDLKYYDTRKNFDFSFIEDIEKDLLRRDFSINALAYDGENIYYLEKSFEDLQAKKLSFIGNPDDRIKEDPFRILRFFRFYSEKFIRIYDKKTFESIEKNKNLIWTLHKEMIKSELIKIIKGDNYIEAFRLINKINLLNRTFILGEYKEKYKERVLQLFDNNVVEI